MIFSKILRRCFLLLTVLFLLGFSNQLAYGQIEGGMENLARVRVDELSDMQILQFKARFKEQGLTKDDLERELLKRNMPLSEINKLKDRLDLLESVNQKVQINEDDEEKPGNGAVKKQNSQTENIFQVLRPNVFGSELFNNAKLTFEPNIKMAAPAGYQLGPDDELLVDVFGYSDQSYRLKVGNDGSLRIPGLGPVPVSGLTQEQAEQKIKSRLAALYPRINSGETRVSVKIGSIRTIQVTVLGEVNLPGTYSLPSVSSVFNALYTSGGPNANGSFRKISVIRGNKVVSRIDIYDFLMDGNSKGNIPLKDQDIIKVDAYKSRVELKGRVKREGFFEILPGDNLESLLSFAGGVTPDAYIDQVKIVRNTGQQKSMVNVQQQSYKTFQLKNGDQIFVDSILSKFENRIEIRGAVNRPGYFGLEANKTLKTLLDNAGGLREDAFMSRITILRKMPNNSREVLSLNLNDVIQNKNDVALQNEDQIMVASEFELKDQYFVNINGPVKKPGKYPFAKNMYVEDLIIMAGGLLEQASTERIQVAQLNENTDKSNPQAELSIIKNVSVRSDLQHRLDSGYVLKPFDMVTIFPNAGYVEQKAVEIKGEVMMPGKYVIMKSNERVSDLIRRAGGLTALGYAGGAILVRKRTNNYRDQVILENKLRTLKKQSKDTLKVLKQTEEEIERTEDIVGINLEEIMKKPGSREDVILCENDILEIPSINQTVMVSGEVLYPVRLSYDKRNSFKKCISNAGGFSAKSLKKRSYIVYANGTAKDTKSFLGIKFYPKVLPGSEIVVPAKEDRKSMSALEVVTIATSVTSLLVLLSTLIK